MPPKSQNSDFTLQLLPISCNTLPTLSFKPNSGQQNIVSYLVRSILLFSLHILILYIYLGVFPLNKRYCRKSGWQCVIGPVTAFCVGQLKYFPYSNKLLMLLVLAIKVLVFFLIIFAQYFCTPLNFKQFMQCFE